MQQQIAMRLYRRASICHRPHQPALQHVQQDITVRARQCIITVPVDVQDVVRVSIVRRDRMRRLTVPASVPVAMAPVQVRRVQPSVLRVHTVQVVHRHVRMLVQVAMRIRLGQQPRVRKVVPQERMVQQLD